MAVTGVLGDPQSGAPSQLGNVQLAAIPVTPVAFQAVSADVLVEPGRDDVIVQIPA